MAMGLVRVDCRQGLIQDTGVGMAVLPDIV